MHCLKCASSTRDVDSVRAQLTELLSDVERAVEQIPDTVERGLVAKIGVEEGQVLAPVRLLLTDVRSASSERLREVQTLLTEEIDRSRESSTLGKTIRALTELLDRRSDSVQGIRRRGIGLRGPHSAQSNPPNLHLAVRPVIDEHGIAGVWGPARPRPPTIHAGKD